MYKGTTTDLNHSTDTDKQTYGSLPYFLSASGITASVGAKIIKVQVSTSGWAVIGK